MLTGNSSTRTQKKPWSTPRLIEKTSIGEARAKERPNHLEAVIVLGGVMVAVGPGS
jgi:hypothetical protein